MCGIFASNDPAINMSHEKIIDKYLAFRGPDNNSGLLNLNKWKVFHSRLSIIAPSKKYSQPFFCDDGSIILYNGEIFNYKKLSNKFIKKNIISDTELLSKIIIRKDFDPNLIDGFFSIIRISKEGKLLNCLRDRFGVKPLFYYKRKEYITISSEASVIKNLFQLKFSSDGLNEYKIFRYPIFSGSYFKGVRSVSSGSCLINKKFFKLINYINLKKKKKKKNLRSVLQKTIKSREVSDVPIGILLSSGIDSNIIRNLSSKDKSYFCGGFKNDPDIIFCKKLKNKEKLNINIFEIKPLEFVKKFKKLIKLRCEPLSVPNEVILSIIADKAKKQGIKVLLSGEGADEFFAGYDRIYRWAKYNKKFNSLEFSKYYCYSKIDSKNLKKLNSFFNKIKNLSTFDKVKAFFIKYHLPILLRRLDFSLMSGGVEGREPFISKDVFFESLKYNQNDLIDKIHGKKPLRKILEKYMGKNFPYRKKIGFPVKLNKIFYNDLNNKNKKNYDLWFEKNIAEIKKL